MLGKRPAELDGPAAPEALWHVWEWFWSLDAARGNNGWSWNPLGFADIEAWTRLSRIQPTPFEVDCLRLLDRAWLREQRKRAPKQGKR